MPGQYILVFFHRLLHDNLLIHTCEGTELHPVSITDKREMNVNRHATNWLGMVRLILCRSLAITLFSGWRSMS